MDELAKSTDEVTPTVFLNNDSCPRLLQISCSYSLPSFKDNKIYLGHIGFLMFIVLVSKITHKHTKKRDDTKTRHALLKIELVLQAKWKRGSYPQLLNESTNICSDGLFVKTSKPTQSHPPVCLVPFLCNSLSILICTSLIPSLALKLSRKPSWVIYYQLRTELSGRQASWESGRQCWKTVGVSYQLNNSNIFKFIITVKKKEKYKLNCSLIKTTLWALAGAPVCLQAQPRSPFPPLSRQSTWLCAAHGSTAAPWALLSSCSGTSSSAASPAHASGSGCTRASACLSAASPSKQPVLLWKKFLFSQTDIGYDPEKRKQ